jgi:hypothetical protein
MGGARTVFPTRGKLRYDQRDASLGQPGIA